AADVPAPHQSASSPESGSSPSQFPQLPPPSTCDTAHEPQQGREQENAQAVSRPRRREIPPWISKQGEEEVRLYLEFVEYGINTLHSTSVNEEDNVLAKNLPSACQQSDALCAICLTIQAKLCPRPQARNLLFKYFDMALRTFRAELGSSVRHLNDGTFTAGLMLSTIGLSRGSAWTMHLHGMYAVLLTRGLQDSLADQTPFRRHLIEVLGYLDLPGFAVGRQNPSIGVWRRHCREPGYLCRPPQLDSVEYVSGLPRSLLDLLSAVDAGEITEEDLWDWPGAPGSIPQCHLWEAYRLAGIVSLRHPQLYTPARGSQGSDDQHGPSSSRSPSVDGSASSPHASASSSSLSSSSSGSRRAVPASTDVLATRIISHVDAIARAYVAPDSHRDSLIFNSIDYPLFVAGIEADVMNGKPELKAAIKNCFAVREEAFKFPSRGTQLLDLMERWWVCGTRGETSINDLASLQGLELGLL
ncbi:hypothetical protein E4U41_000796, partial [Claviceps citrina]